MPTEAEDLAYSQGYTASIFDSIIPPGRNAAEVSDMEKAIRMLAAVRREQISSRNEFIEHKAESREAKLALDTAMRRIEQLWWLVTVIGVLVVALVVPRIW